jgi:hypothetical protein
MFEFSAARFNMHVGGTRPVGVIQDMFVFSSNSPTSVLDGECLLSPSELAEAYLMASREVEIPGKAVKRLNVYLNTKAVSALVERVAGNGK